jgi:hypothetical protein
MLRKGENVVFNVTTSMLNSAWWELTDCFLQNVEKMMSLNLHMLMVVVCNFAGRIGTTISRHG